MTFLRFVTRFRSVGFFLVVVALCIGSQLSMAQTQGRITGRVTDPSGAVIVGAKVTIENVGKKVQRVLETNGSGDYVAPGLEPGLYSVTVEAPNFKKAVRDHVQIEVANDLKIDFSLAAGAANEVMEVKDEAPLVDATTSTCNGVSGKQSDQRIASSRTRFSKPARPASRRAANDPGGGFHTVTSNGLRHGRQQFHHRRS